MRRITCKIEEQLDRIEQCLANAREYLAKNINIEGSGFLHFDDWQGKSGHPLWMKNYMIPALAKCRARKEKTLRDIKRKAKDRRITERKRRGMSEE